MKIETGNPQISDIHLCRSRGVLSILNHTLPYLHMPEASRQAWRREAVPLVVAINPMSKRVFQYLCMLYLCMLCICLLQMTNADELGAALQSFAEPQLDLNLPRYVGSGSSNGAGTGIRAGAGAGTGSGDGSGAGSDAGSDTDTDTDADTGSGSGSGSGRSSGAAREQGRNREWNRVIGRGALGPVLPTPAPAYHTDDDDGAVGAGGGEGSGGSITAMGGWFAAGVAGILDGPTAEAQTEPLLGGIKPDFQPLDENITPIAWGDDADSAAAAATGGGAARSSGSGSSSNFTDPQTTIRPLGYAQARRRGCDMDPPFLLVAFHQGGNIAKYTRDGCFLAFDTLFLEEADDDIPGVTDVGDAPEWDAGADAEAEAEEEAGVDHEAARTGSGADRLSAHRAKSSGSSSGSRNSGTSAGPPPEPVVEFRSMVQGPYGEIPNALYVTNGAKGGPQILIYGACGKHYPILPRHSRKSNTAVAVAAAAAAAAASASTSTSASADASASASASASARAPALSHKEAQLRAGLGPITRNNQAPSKLGRSRELIRVITGRHQPSATGIHRRFRHTFKSNNGANHCYAIALDIPTKKRVNTDIHAVQVKNVTVTDAGRDRVSFTTTTTVTSIPATATAESSQSTAPTFAARPLVADNEAAADVGANLGIGIGIDAQAAAAAPTVAPTAAAPLPVQPVQTQVQTYTAEESHSGSIFASFQHTDVVLWYDFFTLKEKALPMALAQETLGPLSKPYYPSTFHQFGNPIGGTNCACATHAAH